MMQKALAKELSPDLKKTLAPCRRMAIQAIGCSFAIATMHLQWAPWAVSTKEVGLFIIRVRGGALDLGASRLVLVVLVDATELALLKHQSNNLVVIGSSKDGFQLVHGRTGHESLLSRLESQNIKAVNHLGGSDSVFVLPILAEHLIVHEADHGVTVFTREHQLINRHVTALSFVLSENMKTYFFLLEKTRLRTPYASGTPKDAFRKTRSCATTTRPARR